MTDTSETLPAREHPERAVAGEGKPVLERPWAQLADAVVGTLEANPEKGLTAEEAAQRRARYGPNRLREHPRRSLWDILVSQFKSLIIALLAAAAGVAFLFGDMLEGWAVVAVIVINTAIGFFTELRAVRSMEALAKLGGVSTRVRRDGHVQEVPAEDLVPGDLVVVEGGDVVTADLRLVESSRLQANESALTGESVPVDKNEEPVGEEAPLAERFSMLYKGTSVTRGSGTGLVVATGMQTELGTISALVETAEEEATPLEKRLDRLGRKLIWVTLGVAAAVTASGVFTGKDLVLMIETGLALAVAAIPEGLPIVATIALARGMQRMARRNALVNRLSSVETLGATGVICTDKTGTLTENQMTLVRLEMEGRSIDLEEKGEETFFRLNGQSVDPEADEMLRTALETGVLCNNAALGEGEAPSTGDPLEVALLEAGARAGIHREALLEQWPRAEEEAFDTEVKMMATFHEDGEGAFRVAVKGAPETVLEASTQIFAGEGAQPLGEDGRARWMERNEALAADGLRVLALATKSAGLTEEEPYRDLVFLGLVGLLDPPREDVRPAIEKCHTAGIEVVMVTGDQPVTAQRIGSAVGLVEANDETVVHGGDLKPIDEMDEGEREQLLRTRLFARVSPKQKLDLIGLHQQSGHIVAMTGDGVNDAPALKKADIGIAMGQRGTQVAQEASDMVLQDDAFSTIVAAVEEGRTIFENIRKFVLYLMSCNVSEVMVVGVASFVGATLPILPLQILFLNLVTDVFPALALGLGRGDERLMTQPPRNPKEPILQRTHWLTIAAYGVVFTVAVLGAFVLAQWWLGMAPAEAVTISFLTLAIAQLLHVFNMRTAGAGLFTGDVAQNPYVWGALVLCAGLILAAVYIPLLADVLDVQPPGAAGWGLILGMASIPLLAGPLIRWSLWPGPAGRRQAPSV